MSRFRTVILTLAACLLLTVPALAQEAEAAPSSVSGLTTLILLAGLLAVAAVGGIMLMRDRQNDVD
jgi:hypothetical protein